MKNSTTIIMEYKKTSVPQRTMKAVSSVRFALKELMSTKLLGKLPPKLKMNQLKLY